jgi:uncharacterized protein YndB with AHSA1/START domain
MPTQDYSFSTTAPAEQVWATLTSPTLTPYFFYGLSMMSSWEVDSPIEVRAGDERVGDLLGQVLYAAAPSRLSYFLQADATDPVVYLTWKLQVHRTGCIVRLEIDEPELGNWVSDEDKTWLTLTASLQALLAGSP